MTWLDVLKPWRLIASLLALLYGALVIMALRDSSDWFLLDCGVVLTAVYLAFRLEYPVLVLLPAFAGLFLLCACIGALITDVPDDTSAPVALIDSNVKIWITALVAGGFIGWGIRIARKFRMF